MPTPNYTYTRTEEDTSEAEEVDLGLKPVEQEAELVYTLWALAPPPEQVPVPSMEMVSPEVAQDLHSSMHLGSVRPEQKSGPKRRKTNLVQV